MNILLRTAFQKPEMLQLSIKYEQVAREYFDDDYLTLFVVDHGADPVCMDVINSYPFDNDVIIRQQRHRVCANVMEGLKTASTMAPDFIINMEDDVILHKTYFEYIRKAYELVKELKYSVITSWGYSHIGDPTILRQSDYSCGPGTVISNDFFKNYLLPYANAGYYNNWVPTIDQVNRLNEDNPNAVYSVKNGNLRAHLDWDGLMRRMVDYAAFTEGLRAYVSLCFRLLHIGFYGFNRRGRYPADIISFEDKLKFLEAHIFDPDMLSKLDGTYNDYHIFDQQLDSWDGTLRLE